MSKHSPHTEPEQQRLPRSSPGSGADTGPPAAAPACGTALRGSMQLMRNFAELFDAVDPHHSELRMACTPPRLINQQFPAIMYADFADRPRFVYLSATLMQPCPAESCGICMVTIASNFQPPHNLNHHTCPLDACSCTGTGTCRGAPLQCIGGRLASSGMHHTCMRARRLLRSVVSGDVARGRAQLQGPRAAHHMHGSWWSDSQLVDLGHPISKLTAVRDKSVGQRGVGVREAGAASAGSVAVCGAYVTTFACCLWQRQ